MHYTLVYRSIAVNLSATAQATAMQTAAIDTDTFGLLGLVVDSDTPSTSGAQAIRTIATHSTGAGPIPDGPPLASVLTNFMTGSIATAITAPVTADAVVVAP